MYIKFWGRLGIIVLQNCCISIHSTCGWISEHVIFMSSIYSLYLSTHKQLTLVQCLGTSIMDNGPCKPRIKGLLYWKDSNPNFLHANHCFLQPYFSRTRLSWDRQSVSYHLKRLLSKACSVLACLLCHKINLSARLSLFCSGRSIRSPEAFMTKQV